MEKKHLLLGILISFIWGSNFVSVKYYTEYIPPFFAAFIRLSIVFIILLPFISFPKNNVKNILIVAFLYSVGYLGVSCYAIYIGSSITTVSVLSQSTTFFTAMISWYYFYESFGWRKSFGTLVAALGSALVIYETGFTGNVYSIFFSLMSCLIVALYGVFVRRIRNVSSVNLFAFVCFIGSLFMFIESKIMGEEVFFASMPTSGIIALIYSTLGGTCLSFVGWNYLLKHYSANQVSPIFLLVPLWGTLTSHIVLGENVSLVIILGGIIVAIGTYIVMSAKPDSI